LTPELWQQVCTALDALEPLDTNRRRKELERLRQAAPTLAAEVESLLGQGVTTWGRNLDRLALDLKKDLGSPDETIRQTAASMADLDQEPPLLPGYVLKGGKDNVKFGGMGVVYFGEDQTLHRPVAVKVLRRHLADRIEWVARFEGEARVCAQLQHPGIVPVHQVGRLADGRPFYVMKLVKGDTFAELLNQRASFSEDLLTFLSHFLLVCEAVAYAHAHNVIHRDLKPANVMVGAYGEVLVMDWGLAKVLGEEAAEMPEPPSRAINVGEEGERTPTSAGTTLGTCAYMPPEQAAGRVAELDRRSDVFSLGAILCAILTGRPPYLGPNNDVVLRLALNADLADADTQLARCGADTELLALTRKCLSPRREDRPADAAAVARAIQDYIAGVEARKNQAQLEQKEAEVRTQERLHQEELKRKAAEERAAEERKRRRIAYRLGSVIAILILALAAGGWWMDRSATQSRLERERQQLRDRQRAESVYEEAVQALGASEIEQADKHLIQLRKHLDGMDAADLQQRLAEAEDDLAMLRELDRLFSLRWQVVQQAVIEQIQSGKRGDVLTRMQPKWSSAGVSKEELRTAYAATFAKHGIAPAKMSVEKPVARVNKSHIHKALLGGLDQWFMVEPESQVLLTALNALDPLRRPARQMLADRALGKPLQDELAKLEKEEPEPSSVLYLSELLPQDRAIGLLQKAVQRFPDDHRLLTVLVYRLLLSEPNRAKEALSYARAAWALQPRNSYACLMVAFPLWQDARWEESIRQDRRAIELDNKNVLAHIELGCALLHRGERDAGMTTLRKAVELAPNYADAHNSLGWAHLEKGEYEAAITHLKKAIDLDPNYAVAHSNLGCAYSRKREFDAAIPYLKKAIKLNPKLAIAHNNLGDAYIGKGEYEVAIAHLKKAIELDPNYTVAHSNLGWAYNKKGDHEAAIVHLKKAIALDPSNTTIREGLSWSLVKVGRLTEAREAFRKLLQLTPEDSPQFQPRKKRLETVTGFLNLGPRLQEIVTGKAKLKDCREALRFGELCRIKQYYTSAARLYNEARARDAEAAKKLTPVDLLEFAQVCLLAAAGKGKEPPPEAERPEYRSQALNWLKQYLKAHQQALEKDFNGYRYPFQQNVRLLLYHQDLAEIRPPALKGLPEDERKEWQNFWDDVQKLLKKADGPSST
jgi:tetratricopeptide (TPR) repeat protein/tRNA A-37 threonylcarbamoyl transferase component Bud32